MSADPESMLAQVRHFAAVWAAATPGRSFDVLDDGANDLGLLYLERGPVRVRAWFGLWDDNAQAVVNRTVAKLARALVEVEAS